MTLQDTGRELIIIYLFLALIDARILLIVWSLVLRLIIRSLVLKLITRSLALKLIIGSLIMWLLRRIVQSIAIGI